MEDYYMRVSVYLNIHRNVFSIRAEEGPSKGRVIGHAKGVTLDGVTFHVNKAGQAKVRETGCKNVHAFVRGTVSAAFQFETTEAGRKGMLPWFLSLSHTVGGDAYRAHTLRADHIINVGKEVGYNPYELDTFEDQRGNPVFAADIVHMDTVRGVYARGAA